MGDSDRELGEIPTAFFVAVLQPVTAEFMEMFAK